MDQELQGQNQQQAEMSICKAHSQNLVSCLINLQSGDDKSRATTKMELVGIVSDLMPRGVPMLAETKKYPTIASMAPQLTKKVLRTVLLAMVRDFCSSMNVVRNMNEDQMIEAACMLLDECGNFRLEDYQIMFTMAKRNQIGKIYDRLDIQYISLVMDEFYTLRRRAGEAADKEVKWIEPTNTVSSERVTELYSDFSRQVSEARHDEVRQDQRERVQYLKTLDQVLEDLSRIKDFEIYKPFTEPTNETEKANQ